MKLIKTCFGRVFDDLRQKKLMPLKFIFFVKASTLFVLYPYLTIHMRELGITIEETAVMNSITPFIAIIMPPVAGLFADRIGNFKLMLSLFSAFGGAAALLLLLVPVARTNVQYPNTLVLATEGCDSDANLIYGVYQNYPCDMISDAKTELTLKSCGYSCPLGNLNESYVKDILSSRSYKLNYMKTEWNATYDYVITESDMPQKTNLPQDPRVTRKLENIENYEIAIRQLSSDTLFFPAHKPRLFSFECNAEHNSTLCAFVTDMLDPNQMDSLTFNTSFKAIESMDLDESEERHRYVAENVGCSLSSNEQIETVNIEVRLVDDEMIKLEECKRSCVFTAPRIDVCSNMKFVVEHNAKLTFWAYLTVRVFIGVISGTTFPMFEGAVIAILREEKADYGLQRIYGSLGAMISAPLSGLLIDYVSAGKGYADLRPAFFLYFALKIFTSFLMMLMDLKFKVPSTKVMSEVGTVLRNIEVVALLIATSVLGIAWGYIESFLFWFLQDLGAPTSLMGMTNTVGGLAGLPLLVVSGPIIDKIGHANVIFTGFVCYAIRLLGYSLIYNPWLCLIFESLESITNSLVATASVTYAAKLSTAKTDSTIQGLLGGLHHAVGKGGGSLIGGFLMKAYGTRPTYRIFAVATLITGTVYLLFNLLYLQKRPQVEETEDVKKSEETKNNIIAYKKEKETIENKASNDIEAINNAKNLNNETIIVDQRHTGSDNAAFEDDEEACKCKK